MRTRPERTAVRRVARRAARAALALALLAVLWVVPGATGAVLDPTDPAAPGAADPLPFQKCPIAFSNPPDDFTPPSGLPAQELCNLFGSTDGTSGQPVSAGFAGAATLGVQGAPHLAQWIKVPLTYNPADIVAHVVSVNTPVSGEIPSVSSINYFYPSVYLMSADRTRAGESPPFRVTTMAFGSVPVQVTVRLLQPHRSDGSVVPVALRESNPISVTGAILSVSRDTFGQGPLIVRLSNLLIDGRPVDVGSRCQTATGTLRLHGEGYAVPQGTPDIVPPPGKYNPRLGGLLHGSVDIAAFSRCGTGGEDLSPLLTNAISGPNNPLTLTQGTVSEKCFPQNKPGRCPKPGLLSLPATDPAPAASLPTSPFPIPAH